MSEEDWKRFYGDEYSQLLDELGDEDSGNEFLHQAIYVIKLIPPEGPKGISNKQLKTLANSLEKAAELVNKQPALNLLLAQEKTFESSPFERYEPQNLFAAPQLLELWAAKVRNVHRRSATPGRPTVKGRFIVLSQLVQFYKYYFGKYPPARRESKFHFVCSRILSLGGYPDAETIESDLYEALKLCKDVDAMKTPME